MPAVFLFLLFYVILILMDKRLQKQLIIGFIFLAIFTALASGIYLAVRPEATCFDKKQNQKETGIDCGGPCISCELKNNPPISVKTAPVILSISNNKANIYFQLINSSNEWGAKSFSYHLILTGPNNETQQLDYSDFILPHEVKTFVLPQVAVNFIPQSIKLEIDKSAILWSKPIEGVNLSVGSPFIFSGVKVLEPIPSGGIQKNIYNFTKTLRLGMKDPEVTNLQKVLSLTPSIYPEGKVTGYFGKATKAAVKRFQIKYGIRVDIGGTGEVGPQTRAKLNELYGSGSTVTSYIFDTKKILKLGMTGYDIQKLQEFLALDSGYKPTGMVSGTFDKATETAVKEFQKKYGITVTGQVGSITAAKINELSSQYPETTAQTTSEQFESYEATLKVEGNVYNSTPFNWKTGEISVVLCDSKNNPITIGSIPFNNILSGKTTKFSISWHYEVPQGLTVCTQEVHINVMDINNAFVTSR